MIVRLALLCLKRDWRRHILTVIAIALPLLLYSMTYTGMRGMELVLQRPLRQLMGDIAVFPPVEFQVHRGGISTETSGAFPASDLDPIAGRYSGRMAIPVLYQNSRGELALCLLWGIDVSQGFLHPGLVPPVADVPEGYAPGRMLDPGDAGQDVVVLPAYSFGSAAHARLPWSRHTFHVPVIEVRDDHMVDIDWSATEAITLTAVGTVHHTDIGFVDKFIVPLDTLQRLVGLDGRLSWAALLEPGPDAVHRIQAELQGMLPGYQITTAAELMDLFGGQLHEIRDASRSLRAIMYVIAGLIMVNTAQLLAAVRRREVALLAAIGATPGQVAGVLAAETMLVSWIGATAGYVVGAVLPAARLGFTFDFSQYAATVGTVWAMMALFTIGPAVMVSRIKPLEVLRYE